MWLADHMGDLSRNRVQRRAAILGAGLLLGFTACASGDSGGDGGTGQSVVIATTNFSETKILASMYQQALQAAGVDASIKELTTREVIVPALSKGEVQVTPEYLGAFATYLNTKANGPDAPEIASDDVTASFDAASELAAAENITLLTPSSAQNQNAFAVTKEFATANNLTTLTDLGTYSQSNPIVLGGPPECPQRPFCQPGLEETYGVEVGQFKALDAGGPLTISALNQNSVQVGVVFSSSGSISGNDLVVLEDDKNLQTAENILPAVYTPALTPEIETALDAVSEALTTQALQDLNKQVEVDRQDPATVAKQFLADNNLLG